jgi:hypothetical protein
MSKHIYYSVDPVRPHIDLYNPACCRMMDLAREQGKTSCYLGNKCFNATVTFTSQGQHYQTTPTARHGNIIKPGGYREVRELSLTGLTAGHRQTVSIYQVHGIWKFPNDTSSGIATEKSFTIPADYFASEPQPTQLRWQWCRTVPQTLSDAIPSLFNVPDDQWLLYPDQVDQTISQAYTAGEISVKINIGVREFLIKFTPDSIYAQQLDPIANKLRLVRRCVMTAEQIQNRLQMTSTINDADQTCAICLDTFQQTPYAPTITLPCGHVYHGMCIQSVADTNKPCCYCRAEVNWESVMSMFGGTVGNTTR